MAFQPFICLNFLMLFLCVLASLSGSLDSDKTVKRVWRLPQAEPRFQRAPLKMSKFSVRSTANAMDLLVTKNLLAVPKWLVPSAFCLHLSEHGLQPPCSAFKLENQVSSHCSSQHNCHFPLETLKTSTALDALDLQCQFPRMYRS